MSGPVLRFAPSPNGRLHLGHAYSALLNDRVARQMGGRWLLRIEDIDPLRANPDTIAGVLEDLAWLGLAWPEPVRHQSRHMDEYREGGERLRAAGLLYPCFCSRGGVAAAIADREAPDGTGWPRDPDGAPLYPGTCHRVSRDESEVRIAAGEPHAWRLDMAAAAAGFDGLTWRAFEPEAGERDVPAEPRRWGDVVIRRKDVPTSYHLSVVLDDAGQGVTHVVRGRDLEAATGLHALLAARLGLPLPRYHHHALLRDASGAKLAKSRFSLPLATMRREGVTADEIRRRLGF